MNRMKIKHLILSLLFFLASLGAYSAPSHKPLDYTGECYSIVSENEPSKEYQLKTRLFMDDSSDYERLTKNKGLYSAIACQSGIDYVWIKKDSSEVDLLIKKTIAKN